MMRVVISGPTGSIGMALIKKCIQNQIEVLAICHKGSNRIKNIPQNSLITVFEANLDEFKNLEFVSVKKYDVFFHFAWNGTFGNTRNDMPLQIKNIQYTLDAVGLAEKLGCHTFIGAGSQAEYGRVDGILCADTSVNPENGYGMAKLCAGLMSRNICKQKNIKHIWTRILSVYGPYDGDNTMIISTIDKLLNNQSACFTKGEQVWDYLYSEDAANALLLLADKGVSGKTYCLGSGKAYPLRDYINSIYTEIKQGEIKLGAIPYNPMQVMKLQADIKDLQNDVDFTPMVSFNNGIKKTIEWRKKVNESKY